MNDTNILRRLNWLWKHRHTHDGDDDCCAQLPELRLQIETAGDILQHTRTSPASFDPAKTVTYESNSTTHTFEVPDNLIAEDIGMAIIRAFATITAIPSGWTELASADSGKTKVIWKRLDGTEVNSTFTTGSSVTSVGMTWVIPRGGAASLPDPEISAVASGSSGDIDTAALTPSTAGRTLVMSLWYSSELSYVDSDAKLPTGYEFIGSGLDKHTGNFQTINGAYAFVDIVTSENPPAWNHEGTDWHGWTVGVLMESGAPAVMPGDADHDDLAARNLDANHPQYSLIDGTRAFTGEVAGVTPTADASLATKGYVDSAAVGAHTHTESEVTDLDHWNEADHDALDHSGLTGVGASASDSHIWRPVLDDDGAILTDDDGAAVMGYGPA